jgi:hypothetical protein
MICCTARNSPFSGSTPTKNVFSREYRSGEPHGAHLKRARARGGTQRGIVVGSTGDLVMNDKSASNADLARSS